MHFTTIRDDYIQFILSWTDVVHFYRDRHKMVCCARIEHTVVLETVISIGWGVWYIWALIGRFIIKFRG